jgi:uncharacterized protein YndB with AHSA1/START domain
MIDKFSTTITIDSDPAKVWATLTDLKIMERWLGDPEMKIQAQTDWKVNEAICIRGFHHVAFENKGTVIQYDKEKKLSYSHLSSMSRLSDKPGNYSVLEFILTPIDNCTQLTLIISNFPTETIRKHLEFYWRTTIVTIKKTVENLPG